MRNLWHKISRPGLFFLLLGAMLLYMSAADTLTSFKTPKSFEEVIAGDVAIGDRIEGQVPFLLDSFAVEKTWTENRSTGSVTPKKNSRYYYILPTKDGFVGLSIGSASAAEARKLVDQSYGYLAGGKEPTAEVTVEARASRMADDLAAMFLDELTSSYGLSDREADALGAPILIEPRSFMTIRIFCAAGAVFTVAGAALLWRRWRMF